MLIYSKFIISLMETKPLNTIATYIPAMATTIQVSADLLKELKKRKLFEKESYEDVIWGIIEDTMELSDETKRDIEKAEAEIKAGKFYTHEEVKKKLGF